MLPAIMTGVEYVSRRRKSDMSSRIDSVGSVMFEIQDILAKGQLESNLTRIQHAICL